MISEINDASSNLTKHTKPDDPVSSARDIDAIQSTLTRFVQLSQVVRVLNSHLTQLQEIDQGAHTLQLKVKEAQRAGQVLGSINGLNGPASDAADSFYRSYLGRS